MAARHTNRRVFECVNESLHGVSRLRFETSETSLSEVRSWSFAPLPRRLKRTFARCRQRWSSPLCRDRDRARVLLGGIDTGNIPPASMAIHQPCPIDMRTADFMMVHRAAACTVRTDTATSFSHRLTGMTGRRFCEYRCAQVSVRHRLALYPSGDIAAYYFYVLLVVRV